MNGAHAALSPIIWRVLVRQAPVTTAGYGSPRAW